MMYSCQQVTRLKNESFNRSLNWKERFGLRFHLFMCAGCTHMARQLDFLNEASRRYFQDKTEKTKKGDERLSDEARRRIKDTIEQHQSKS